MMKLRLDTSTLHTMLTSQKRIILGDYKLHRDVDHPLNVGAILPETFNGDTALQTPRYILHPSEC